MFAQIVMAPRHITVKADHEKRPIPYSVHADAFQKSLRLLRGSGEFQCFTCQPAPVVLSLVGDADFGVFCDYTSVKKPGGFQRSTAGGRAKAGRQTAKNLDLISEVQVLISLCSYFCRLAKTSTALPRMLPRTPQTTASTRPCTPTTSTTNMIGLAAPSVVTRFCT